MDTLAPSRDGVFTVAAGHGVPVEAGDPAAAQVVGRSAPSVVILQTAAEVVGRLIVLGHGIELLDREVIQITPGAGGIRADVNATIVAVNHAVGVLGIDPQSVMVHMNASGSRA